MLTKLQRERITKQLMEIEHKLINIKDLEERKKWRLKKLELYNILKKDSKEREKFENIY